MVCGAVVIHISVMSGNIIEGGRGKPSVVISPNKLLAEDLFNTDPEKKRAKWPGEHLSMYLATGKEASPALGQCV